MGLNSTNNNLPNIFILQLFFRVPAVRDIIIRADDPVNPAVRVQDRLSAYEQPFHIRAGGGLHGHELVLHRPARQCSLPHRMLIHIDQCAFLAEHLPPRPVLAVHVCDIGVRRNAEQTEEGCIYDGE